MNHIEFLKSLGACDEAVRWAKSQPDLSIAWQNCDRADWMLWLAGKTLDKKIVSLAACACAETAYKYINEDSQLAFIWAIDAARRWATGYAELEEVRAAADAAADAAAYAAYADAAADAAAYAAYADAAASYAAYAAAYAAAAYAYDAAYSADAADAARKTKLKELSALIREQIPFEIIQGRAECL